jgi:hypothetical protein
MGEVRADEPHDCRMHSGVPPPAVWHAITVHAAADSNTEQRNECASGSSDWLGKDTVPAVLVFGMAEENERADVRANTTMFVVSGHMFTMRSDNKVQNLSASAVSGICP